MNNRITEDARVAHTELRAARVSDFPTPTDLISEQQRVYRAAAAGYVALFADRPARAVEIDPWEAELDGLDLRLVSPLGLALELADGSPEIRTLKIGVAGNRPLIDDADRRALVVARRRVGGHASAAARDRRPARGRGRRGRPRRRGRAARRARWIEQRVALVRERAADPVPKAGDDCRGCPFVPGCKAHFS